MHANGVGVGIDQPHPQLCAHLGGEGTLSHRTDAAGRGPGTCWNLRASYCVLKCHPRSCRSHAPIGSLASAMIKAPIAPGKTQRQLAGVIERASQGIEHAERKAFAATLGA